MMWSFAVSSGFGSRDRRRRRRPMAVKATWLTPSTSSTPVPVETKKEGESHRARHGTGKRPPCGTKKEAARDFTGQW
jgi:hypothetical protein